MIPPGPAPVAESALAMDGLRHFSQIAWINRRLTATIAAQGTP